MILRIASVRDVETVDQLERACFDDPWSPGLVAAELASGNRVVLVDDEGRGYASASLAGDVADLLRVAVRPDARRSGLGRALVDRIAEEMASLGATRLLLEVAADNVAARELYASTGFAEISRRAHYYGDIDALVLERGLT